MTVKRMNRGELAKPTRTPEGWLLVEGKLSRTGIFTYCKADGTEHRELRPLEEVFDPDSLASFALRPVTVDHPDEWLSAANVQKYAVGSVGEQFRADGGFVAAKMLITSETAIKALEAGEKRELSCGYTCDLDATPGEWQGERYDAIQRNIRGNHVAIVERGRAGPEARVRMDAATAMEITTPPGTVQAPNPKEQTPMRKIRINGVEYEVSEQAAQAFERHSQDASDAAAKLLTERDTTRAELAKLQAKTDALAEDLKKAEQARKDATDPKHLRSLISARVALETQARELLEEDGEEDALATMDDAEIKRQVILAAYPDRKLDGKSADYLDAAFEGAVERLTEKAEKADRADSSLARARKAVVDKTRTDMETEDAEEGDEDAARERMLARHRDAWKAPLSSKQPRS